MFDFLVHLVEGVGHDTSVRETTGITKSVKVNKESDDLKVIDIDTKVIKLKSKKDLKKSIAHRKSSKPAKNEGESRSNNGIQLTFQIMPVVSVENETAVPRVSQIRSDAQLVNLDEDYDS